MDHAGSRRAIHDGRLASGARGGVVFPLLGFASRSPYYPHLRVVRYPYFLGSFRNFHGLLCEIVHQFQMIAGLVGTHKMNEQSQIA
jgi:hypothetical protein